MGGPPRRTGLVKYPDWTRMGLLFQLRAGLQVAAVSAPFAPVRGCHADRGAVPPLFRPVAARRRLPLHRRTGRAGLCARGEDVALMNDTALCGAETAEEVERLIDEGGRGAPDDLDKI